MSGINLLGDFCQRPDDVNEQLFFASLQVYAPLDDGDAGAPYITKDVSK